MTTQHYFKGRCANLAKRNSSILLTQDVKQVNCSRCILTLNKAVMNTFIKESSKYTHSNYVGVDLLRTIPKWVVMGFHSYTIPSKAIEKAFKLSNPKSLFIRNNFYQVVALRGLNPNVDREHMKRVLTAFKQCWVYVIDQINGNTGLNVQYTFSNETIDIDNPRTKARIGTIDVLGLESDLGYIPQFVLSIIIGKMANIRVSRPDLPLFALMEQIFSNQSNTSQKAYRTMIKAILNGRFYEIDELSSLFPQINGLHHEIVDSMIESPEYFSINRSYIGELRIIEEGL